jgi:uncharacterized FAD-dependent dehydrogenase
VILTADRDLSFDLELDEADDMEALRTKVAGLLGVAAGELPALEVRKRAIDARRGRVRFHLTVGAATEAPADPRPRKPVTGKPVIIVGAGPAGMFCAYALAKAGVAAIVLDRGKNVQARRHDLKGLTQHGKVDPDSNYCFGEGGAGTYSDGKLYTRSHKRGDVRDVLEILAAHGAPPEILVDARPHIGSNKLPKVITSIREHLESLGVQFAFERRVTTVRTSAAAVIGVNLRGGADLDGSELVMATGHSARDVFELLATAGAQLEVKPFALGVRIEHPQQLINETQYGRRAGHPRLPAAYYKLAHTPTGDRGVFSFCMCPGGWVVPAATEADGVVVNGMSLSRRDSRFANSGLVVAIERADLATAGLTGLGIMAGVEMQRRVEQAAKHAGGGALRAPATRVTDFMRARGSTTLPECSYEPGLNCADVGTVLAASGLDLAPKIRAALEVFARQMRGYVTDEAVLIGVESRTSSPIRVLRDPGTLQSNLAGLYPCGEGAGYAGGIVSAAVDGMRVAAAICQARGITPR